MCTHARTHVCTGARARAGVHARALTQGVDAAAMLCRRNGFEAVDVFIEAVKQALQVPPPPRASVHA